MNTRLLGTTQRTIDITDRQQGGFLLPNKPSSMEQRWRQDRATRTVQALRRLQLLQAEGTKELDVIMSFHEPFHSDRFVEYFIQHFGIHPVDEGLYLKSGMIKVIDPDKAIVEIEHERTSDDEFLPGVNNVLDIVTLEGTRAVTCLKSTPDRFGIGLLKTP